MMKPRTRLETRVVQTLLGGMGILLVILGSMAVTHGWANNLLHLFLGVDPSSPPTPDWQTNLQRFGKDVLVRGLLLLLAFGWLSMPRFQSGINSLVRRTRLLIGLATGFLIIFWLPVSLIGYSTTIAGVRYWWLFDDAMISMRYAYNLAHGNGLVWNAGQYVEGYTNFLWTLYMALIHLLPIPISQTALVVSLTNILLSAAAIPVLVRLVNILDGDTPVLVATLIGYVLNLNVMGWATAGAETSLLALLFLSGLYRVLRDAEQEQSSLFTALLIGSMTLVRSDAFVLAALLYALSLLQNRRRTTVAVHIALSLLLPVAHTLFRLFYYGDVLPNTAYLKVSNWDNKYEVGLSYLLAFGADYLLVLLFAIVGPILSRSRTQRLLLGMVLLYLAYVVSAGGDAFPQYRFIVPVLPLIFLLAYMGVQRITGRQAVRLLLATLCLVTMPLMTPGDTSPLYVRRIAIGNLKIALLLKQNLVPTSTVADFWAGIPFYFSGAQGIDLLGKNDPYIAHLPARYGNIPGHNKFDFDYSLGTLKPDIVIGTLPLPLNEQELQKMAQGVAPWHSLLYFNQTFREHCLPYPVTVDTWRTMFVCDWSEQEMQRRDAWVVPFDTMDNAGETRLQDVQ